MLYVEFDERSCSGKVASLKTVECEVIFERNRQNALNRPVTNKKKFCF